MGGWWCGRGAGHHRLLFKLMATKAKDPGWDTLSLVVPKARTRLEYLKFGGHIGKSLVRIPQAW